MPALLIWRNNSKTTWLIFDEDEPELYGRVQVMDWYSRQAPIECRFPAVPGSDEHAHPSRYCRLFKSWLEYLEFFWDVNIECVTSLSAIPPVLSQEHRPMVQPIPYEFGSWTANVRPSPPWVSRGEPQIQEDMQNFSYPDYDH
ncbi:hypothetical protein D9613_003629 [Agrocybe pediades]|uniref:Uncharacterized protein n=1 Tax=Agrocybe pediades TaxID=84607 RepID=A0A8H4QI81_9AGAR|nr:hypothetical protein D9613_003629 [Agrocybe pediades]